MTRATRPPITRGYDGAQLGRKAGNWTPAGASASVETASSLPRLRARSRDLIRNNPLANRAQRMWSAYTVHYGITPSFKAQKTQALFAAWAKDCDADQCFDFYGLQALVDRTVFESGECLIVLKRSPLDGSLKLLVLEPDYLDDYQTKAETTGGWTQGGIEFLADGTRDAYWLHQQHPGGNLGGLRSVRVDAKDVIHVFEKTRPGQNRGVPRLSSVMMTIKDLDDYQNAVIERKISESGVAVFVTTDDDNRRIGEESTDGDRVVEEISPNMVQYLRTGEDIKFNSPAPSNDNSYITGVKRDIAAGARVSYEMLTGDLSQVNYSSLRSGALDFRREVEQYQWLIFIPVFLDRVIKRWLEIVGEGTPVKDQTVTWVTPKFAWVDPLKDVKGEEMELSLGIKSWSDSVRERGLNPADVMTQIAEDKKMFDAAGLVYPAARDYPPQPVQGGEIVSEDTE